jgi:hypothetical protein
MRACILVLVSLAAAMLPSTASLHAQVPAPGAAAPEDRAAADAAGQAKSPAVPAGAEEKRNWLLARLIVDQNFDRAKIHAIEQNLAQMSPAQLDVLVQVYQERQRKRDAVEQSQLDEARGNLEQMKAYRNVLAQDLDNLRAFRQAQYLNFGLGGSGFGFGGTRYGGFGYGGVGYGGGLMGYGPGFGNLYSGLGSVGYGGFGYGGLGYGGIGYGAAYPYGYGGGMPAAGMMGYPNYGGYMPGMGAGY